MREILLMASVDCDSLQVVDDLLNLIIPVCQQENSHPLFTAYCEMGSTFGGISHHHKINYVSMSSLSDAYKMQTYIYIFSPNKVFFFSFSYTELHCLLKMASRQYQKVRCCWGGGGKQHIQVHTQSNNVGEEFT